MKLVKILVDLDTKQELPIDRIQFINEVLFLDLRLDKVFYSPSGRGYHLEMTTGKRLTPAQVVAIQSILGSDWKREVFNFKRASSIHKLPQTSLFRANWNVLFHTKNNKERQEVRICQT